MISQSGNKETDWTIFVKQAISKGFNTWISAVNESKRGTFPKAFNAKYKQISYDVWETESKFTEREIKESDSQREKFKNQFFAAKSDNEADIVLESVKKYETNSASSKVKINSSRGTDLTFLAYEDDNRLIENSKRPDRKTFFDSAFVISNPELLSKLNKVLTKGSMSDADFLKKLEGYESESGIRRAATWPNVPLVYHPKAKMDKPLYQIVLNHELGHVLGLLDVYVEFKGETNQTERTLMGGHAETGGMPQSPDIQGIFAAISVMNGGKAVCPKNYETYSKGKNVFYSRTLYCKPKLKQPSDDISTSKDQPANYDKSTIEDN